MRVVIVGAILVYARPTMADPAALMEKLMSKAFMPALATPQGGSYMFAHTEASVAPGDRTPMAKQIESNPAKEITHLPREVFKLEETNHRMKTEREGFRSQITVTSPMTHAQTMLMDAHWRTAIYGMGRLGYGVCVVFLLSIIYKIYSEWNHLFPVISRSPLDDAELQSSAATALPLFSSSGGPRAPGVASESEGPGGSEAMHDPEPTQAGKRSRDVKMQFVPQDPWANGGDMRGRSFDPSMYMGTPFRRAVDVDVSPMYMGTHNVGMAPPPYRRVDFRATRGRPFAGPDGPGMSPHDRAVDRVMSPYRQTVGETVSRDLRGRAFVRPDSSRYGSPPYYQADDPVMSPPYRWGADRGRPPPYRQVDFSAMRGRASARPESSRYRPPPYQQAADPGRPPPYQQAVDPVMSPPYRRAADRVMSPSYRRAASRDMQGRAHSGPDSSRYRLPLQGREADDFIPSRAVAGHGPSIREQGRSLRTWSFASPNLDQVQVILITDGRPLDASVELWNGPKNTPIKMRVYAEDGNLTPFNATFATPRGSNTVAVLNSNESEFSLTADVVENNLDGPSPECFLCAENICGGALHRFPVDPTVDCVQVFLQPNGRPLNAKIELHQGRSSWDAPGNGMQGPSNQKQVIELATDDGLELPFLAYILTPGPDNVVSIFNNNASVEFPMDASVVPDRLSFRRQDDSPDVGHDADSAAESSASAPEVEVDDTTNFRGRKAEAEVAD